MAASAERPKRWQHIAIHSAVLAGARMEAIEGALGSGLREASDRRHEWASRQRGLILDRGHYSGRVRGGRGAVRLHRNQGSCHSARAKRFTTVPRVPNASRPVRRICGEQYSVSRGSIRVTVPQQPRSAWVMCLSFLIPGPHSQAAASLLATLGSSLVPLALSMMKRRPDWPTTFTKYGRALAPYEDKAHGSCRRRSSPATDWRPSLAD
jgi:hypothetical protein